MISPHGLKKLENRFLNNTTQQELNKLAQGSLSIQCDDDNVLECERIADGSLTPLKGFMSSDEIDSVIEYNRLISGTFFPLPVFLQVDENYKDIDSQTVFLKDKNNNVFGFVENGDFFEYDLQRLCQFMFGTCSYRHPGVERVLNNRNVFLGGDLKIIPQINDLSDYCMTPKQTRKKIEESGWETCVGFQTRNVPHLAHEHLQRIALEVHDGLLLHPVIGWKKSDDYVPKVVMEAYKHMANNIYPAGKIILSGLQIQMRYAGPKEAVMHAIIRQNFGCTHFIVGRDHAGVGGFYDKYDAHKIFDSVGECLEIEILKLKGPVYCNKCGGIVTENTCGHNASQHEEVSGTLIRDMIIQGKYPPEKFIRKEIVDVVRTFDEIFVSDALKVKG